MTGPRTVTVPTLDCGDVTLAERLAALRAGGCVVSTPPKPGKSLSVRVDETLSDDLATIMRTGMTASDAVRYAVAFLAHGYSWVWESGIYPNGVAPARMAVRVPAYDGGATPTASGRAPSPDPR